MENLVETKNAEQRIEALVDAIERVILVIQAQNIHIRGYRIRKMKKAVLGGAGDNKH